MAMTKGMSSISGYCLKKSVFFRSLRVSILSIRSSITYSSYFRFFSRIFFE